jgi:hypothetical protein
MNDKHAQGGICSWVVPPHNHQYMMVQSDNVLFFRMKMRQAINGAFSAILLTVNLPTVAPGRPIYTL